MCTCEKPNVNGTPGYRWQPSDRPSTHPVHAPELDVPDEIMYDLPGRCGQCDSHSFHFTIVKNHRTSRMLYVRHGGGQESYSIGSGVRNHRQGILDALERCPDDDARYWLVQTLYHTLREVKDEATTKERETWKRAAREGRLKIRSRKGIKFAQIEPEIRASALAN
jgi:hypothetical protein